MILFCCASELGLPEDLSAIEVILYYYYYYYSTITVPTEIQRAAADIFVLDNRLSFNKYTDEIAKKKQLTF